MCMFGPSRAGTSKDPGIVGIINEDAAGCGY